MADQICTRNKTKCDSIEHQSKVNRKAPFKHPEPTSCVLALTKEKEGHAAAELGRRHKGSTGSGVSQSYKTLKELAWWLLSCSVFQMIQAHAS